MRWTTAIVSTLPANTWQQFTVPLSALGVANHTNFTGFVIQDATGGTQPTFYVDDISLVAGTNISTPGTANVTVNLSSDLTVLPATGYGIHTSVYSQVRRMDDTIWMKPKQNGHIPGKAVVNPADLAVCRHIWGPVAAARFELGRRECPALSRWRLRGFVSLVGLARPTLGSANGYGMAPWHPNNCGYMGPNADFGGFLNLLTNAQCQALITVNFGAGQKWSTTAHTSLTAPTTNAEPPEAAAWVAYANAGTNIYGTTNDVTLGTDSQGNDWKTAGYWAMMRAATPLATDDGYNFLRIGRKAPIGIKDWEIGNESFGTGYFESAGDNGYCLDYAVPYPYTIYPRYGNANLSPAAYGKCVRSFSLLMKKVDPSIKIGAVVSTPPGDYSWDSYDGQHWTPQVLAQCATNIDFVIAHLYPWNGSLDDGSGLLPIPGPLYPAMIDGTTPHTGTSAGLRDEIAAYRVDATNVQIFITEFGHTLTVNVSIPTVSLAGSAAPIQFGISNFSGGSNIPNAPPTTNTISVSGNSLSVTLPAFTMAELTIPVIGNTPPVLAAVSNYTVNVGQTVAFTASATDTDQPPQMLTFALLSGTTNATLNTSSGAFSFRPFVTQTNSTNNFTLTVSDNGSPSMSAAQSFSVVVNPLSASGINNISFAFGQFSFNVDDQNGPDYAIETSTNLTQWSNILITNSPVLPFNRTDTNAAAPQRFYLVKIGPPLP